MKGLLTQILHSDRFGAEGRLGKPEHGAIHKAVHHSVAYGYDKASDLADVFQGKAAGYAYGRQANPTVDALEKKIAQMEKAQDCICFATGMAAIGALLQSLLKKGDHFLSSRFLFGNTNSQFQTHQVLGVEVDFFDSTSTAELDSLLKENTKMVFVETIANPVTQVAQLDALAAFCKTHKLLFVVDSTMTSPALVHPIDFGANLVVHSLTKYIGGHGNVLGGALVDCGNFDWTTWENIYEPYKKFPQEKWGITQVRKKSIRDFGAVLHPQAAHQIAIGAETLPLRMKQSGKNAMDLAVFLENHEKVSCVYFPGLSSHAQHEWTKSNFNGFGSILSFDLKEEQECLKFLDALKLVIVSSNLGDNRTLAIPVAQTIFFEMGEARRQSMNIGESMIRVSLGIEDTEDIIADFNQAFAII